jgi:lipopolysaccharide export LptBFGC system permease protein LptF
MSLSEIVIKIVGIILVIVGLALILSVVGVNILGIGVSNIWVALIFGVAFLGAGIWIIRGGTISL